MVVLPTYLQALRGRRPRSVPTYPLCSRALLGLRLRLTYLPTTSIYIRKSRDRWYVCLVDPGMWIILIGEEETLPLRPRYPLRAHSPNRRFGARCLLPSVIRYHPGSPPTQTHPLFAGSSCTLSWQQCFLCSARLANDALAKCR